MNFSFSTNGSVSQTGAGVTRKLSGKAAVIIGLVMGIIFAGIGVFSFIRDGQTKDWPTVSGQITSSVWQSNYNSSSNSNNNSDYYITVSYNVGGTDYRMNYTSSTNESVGTKVDVKYNPNNPSDAQSGNMALMAWIFTVLGGALAAGSLIGLVVMKLRQS